MFLLYAVVCLASNNHNHRHRPSIRPRALIRTGRSQHPAFARSYYPSLSAIPHYSRHIIARHQLRRLQLEEQALLQQEPPESLVYRLTAISSIPKSSSFKCGQRIKMKWAMIQQRSWRTLFMDAKNNARTGDSAQATINENFLLTTNCNSDCRCSFYLNILKCI